MRRPVFFVRFKNVVALAVVYLLFSFLFISEIFSQVTIAGSTGADGNYSTLKLAFDAINSQAVQGGNNIIITITASVADNNTAVLNQPATSSWTSLIIYPTGSGYSLSGSVAAALIELNGADNVTIDGRVNAAGATEDLVIKNSNTSSGAKVIRLLNDATSNTIKYSKIYSYNTNSGATDGAIFLSTTTGSTGNDNNLITNCIIGTDDNTKLVGNAFQSNGTATKENSGNTVTICKIFDFKVYGIYINSSTTGWTISNNSFYQTTAFTPGANVKMINLTSGSGYNITGNYFGGQDVLCGGASPFTLNSSAYTLTVISSGTSTSGGTITISGNIIKNISVTSTNSTAGESAFAGFSLFGNNDYIIGSSGNGNQFGETSGAVPSIMVAANNISMSPFQGIYTSTSVTIQTVSIAYNTFGAISITSTSTPALCRFIAAVATANYYSSLTIDNNVIGNTTTNNIVYEIKNVFYGIDTKATISPVTCNITNNTIQGINFSAGANDNNSGYLIYFNSTAGNSCNVTGNTINDISLATSGASATKSWYFIKSSTGAGTLTVNSNSISNITQSATTYCWVSFIEIDNSGTVTCNSNIIGSAAPANNISLASANNDHKGIYFGYQGVFNINSNTIQQVNQTSAASTASFQAIIVDYGAASTATLPSCSLNVIRNISCAGTNTGSDNFMAIYFRGTTGDIDNNTIQNITTATKFNGIIINSGSATTMSITDNSITNIIQTGAGIFSGIEGGGSTSISVTGNTINDIDFTSTSTSIPLFSAINASGAGAITIGSLANPNIIGSNTGVWSATDGISITNNAASSGSQGSLSLIKIAGTSGAVNVTYNNIGGIRVSGSNTSGKICLVENLCGVDATIGNNVFGNSAADNMDFIAGMREEWITNYSTTVDRSILSGSPAIQIISDNVFQNIKISTATASPIFGILNELGLNQTVSNGSVQYCGLECTGNTFSKISSTATSSFKLISNGNTVYNRLANFDISDNSIDNFTISAASAIYFIYVDSRVGPASMNSNVIGNSTPNNINIGSNCSVYGIYFTDSNSPNGPYTYTFNGNTIQQFSLTNTGVSNKFYGIYFGPSSSNTQYCTITNNNILNITSASKYASTTEPSLSSIYLNNTGGASTNNSISGNIISDLALTDGTAINNLVTGLFFANASASYTVTKNHIYKISNLSTGGSGIISGVFKYYNAATTSDNFKYHNNAIVLDNSPNTNSISMYGIYGYWAAGATSGAPELYHNTIKIAGTSGGTTTSSAYYLYNSDGTTFSVKNNIFQNLRIGGSGFNYAFQQVKVSPVGSWDYNYLEVTDNAAKCVHWGSAGAPQDYSFAGWQGIPQGVNDITGTISLGASGNVPAATTADIKSNGINTLGITTDIDGVLRASGAVTIPCGACDGPWRGAYEAFNPLPIELLSLKAFRSGDNIKVDWITASEINTDYFLLLKSTDGINYNTIAKIKGAGNSNEVRKYGASDPNPSPGNYYKIQQFDLDGNNQFFGPIAVSFSEEPTIQVFPNPSNGNLNLFFGSGNKNFRITIFDVMGKQMFETFSDDINIHLDLSSLPKGTFFLVISDDEFAVWKKKIIKQ